jgi:hypothetical protein
MPPPVWQQAPLLRSSGTFSMMLSDAVSIVSPLTVKRDRRWKFSFGAE